MLTQSSPVFVVGMPRSGTTLLASLLSAHSALAIGPETAYFDLVWKPLERSGGLAQWPEVERQLTEFFRKPSVTVMHLPVAEVLAELHQRWSDHQLSYGSILSVIMQAYATAVAKPRWGEKTPGHFMFVPAIRREFPDAKIIFIVRDPRDIHLSLNQVAWNDGNAFNHALQWREYQAIADRYDRIYGEALYRVRYEDLIADPTQVLQQLTQYLGLSFEPAMLERYQTQQLFDPKDEPWKRRVASPIDASNAGKWKTRLSADEIALFNRVCGRYLRQSNYECPSGGRFQLSIVMNGLDRRAVLWWARMAWRLSRNRDPWLDRPLLPKGP